MLAALAQRGLAENSLIIFLSDHGDSLGDHGLFVKGATCTTRPSGCRWSCAGRLVCPPVAACRVWSSHTIWPRPFYQRPGSKNRLICPLATCCRWPGERWTGFVITLFVCAGTAASTIKRVVAAAFKQHYDPGRALQVGPLPCCARGRCPGRTPAL